MRIGCANNYDNNKRHPPTGVATYWWPFFAHFCVLLQTRIFVFFARYFLIFRMTSWCDSSFPIAHWSLETIAAILFWFSFAKLPFTLTFLETVKNGKGSLQRSNERM